MGGYGPYGVCVGVYIHTVYAAYEYVDSVAYTSRILGEGTRMHIPIRHLTVCRRLYAYGYLLGLSSRVGLSKRQTNNRARGAPYLRLLDAHT